jgi:polyphosphate glucokinase
MEARHILGIDIGGSGMKAAIVDLQAGELITERHRIETPKPATPEAMARVVKRLVNHFEWKGPVGCGFPAAIRHGVAVTASNVAKRWIGTAVDELFNEATGLPFIVLNDADAAALAEMKYGAGKDSSGVSILITIGTGIGTAVFNEGVLLPNTELGHVHLPGHIEDAERYASDAARKRRDLSWPEWAEHLDAYLQYMHGLFFPDRFFIGGGASKKFNKFEDYLSVPVPVIPCQLKNEAGIIGAAYAAKDL